MHDIASTIHCGLMTTRDFRYSFWKCWTDPKSCRNWTAWKSWRQTKNLQETGSEKQLSQKI